ncbi:MauM/NapG family ferredoxin-type protein [Castellaniella caeni]|uniref:MauM/NapG family ferredoxin-type protein n=1 Tax=Castellaniella caeni TaxID=266123 RepID=UPI0009FCC8E2|nr:MauM/NapG family ferredoxin-type protein [Castellaniella caeni]
MAQSRFTRRCFVQTGLCGLVVGAGATLPLFDLAREARAQVWVRPPGALAEPDFLAACIRCGLCVQACPFETLQLFELNGSADAGTPYFVARSVPCEMCTDIPCLQACPTGALSPALSDIREADMGVAVVSHPDLCNSMIGLAYCDSCFRACPLQGEAIHMAYGETGLGGMFTPVVDPDVCTGCGKCEHACVAQPDAAIRVVPSHAA